MALGRPLAALMFVRPGAAALRCPRRGAGDLVRAKGFEPLRLSTREPKSRASTSSATPAKGTLAAAPTPGLFPSSALACVAAGRRGLYHAESAPRTRKMADRVPTESCLLRRQPPGYEATPNSSEPP